MKSFLVDQDGYYGEFGGAYVPKSSTNVLRNLEISTSK